MSDPVVRLADLVAILADEVIRQTRPAGAGATTRCRCHDVLTDCCPASVAPLLDAGASRLGLAATGGAPAGVAGLIDHTLLRPDATRTDVEQWCGEAVRHGFASVCVNPTWVATCAAALRGTGVPVCAVVGFPLGATTPDVKQFEARRTLADGAREVDMVINIGALKSGDVALVERDIAAVTRTCHERGAIVKAILETALLTDEEKATACVLAKAAGAAFVKTSTGFGPGGATVADVALMRRVVGPEMGVKASGGIHDRSAVDALVAAGATRIGASAGVRIVTAGGGA